MYFAERVRGENLGLHVGPSLYTANVCHSKCHNHFEAKTNYATGFTAATKPWIVDSRATHHITKEPHNLQSYHNNEEFSMGDGNKISIYHTSSTLLNASNNILKLTHTLCALSIKLKLISISLFCQDNLKLFEFFHFDFVVKDMKMWKPLVHYQIKNGLYEWFVPSPKRT